MPFCETNPAFFQDFFYATLIACGTCGGNVWKILVGSFWKTNPVLEGKRGLKTRIWANRTHFQIEDNGGAM
jgi:hypothetical protein